MCKGKQPSLPPLPWKQIQKITYIFYRQIFGFSKDSFRFILDIALPKMEMSGRNNVVFLTPVQRMCIFLDFLRTNAFQRVIGTQTHNQVHQSTACRVVNELAHIFGNMMDEVSCYKYLTG